MKYLPKLALVLAITNLVLFYIFMVTVYEPNPILLYEKKMDSTAIDVLDRINPISMDEDFEYAGLIVATSSRYFATEPATICQKHLSITPAWKGSIYAGVAIARYHTHAAHSPGYGDCRFSKQDTNGIKITHYLATPCGTILKFDPKDRMVYTYDRALEAWELVARP